MEPYPVPRPETYASPSTTDENGEPFDCHFCHRRPAIRGHLEFVAGFGRRVNIGGRRGTMCKEHGEALANELMQRTLRWGRLSPRRKTHPAYQHALQMNQLTLDYLAQLDPPSGGPAEIDTRCIACARTPALAIHVVAYVGNILTFRRLWREGTFCRDHGLPIAEWHYKRTLNQGWWSPISFFLTPFALRKDRKAIREFRALPPPIGEMQNRADT